MALILKDRVRETTLVSGANDVALAGPVIGFQAFSVLGNNNTTYYCIAGQGTNEWEVGIGTYVSGTNTLERTTVLSNSAGTAPSKINFLSGVKDVFVTYPASKSVDTDTAQTLTNKTLGSGTAITGGTINGTTIGASTPSTGAFTDLSASGTTTLSGGTANGVAYLNGSKALTTGSALTFDGTTFSLGSGGSGTIATILSINATDNAGQGGYILGKRNGSRAWYIGDTAGALGSGTGLTSYNYGTAPWIWYLQTGGEQMRLTSTGLGIGTSSPLAKLVVSNGSEENIEFGTGNVSLNGGYIEYVNRNSTTTRPDFNYYLGASNGNHKFYTYGAERMRIDASGNVGIGTSSPVSKLDVSGSGDIKATVQSTSSGSGANSALVIKTATEGNWLLQTGNVVFGGLRFNNDGGERMRIDSSGNLLVGMTSIDPIGARTSGIALRPASAGIQVRSSNSAFGLATSSGTHIGFYTDNGSSAVAAGSISSNGSTTSYNTSSDYRLKEAIVPMTGALAKNELLNPVTYKWKVDGSDGQGFIAHELQAVFPDAVTGEKDAVDDEGTPVYQGVDTSFLVGHLVACVKELTAELNNVKAELVILKGN